MRAVLTHRAGIGPAMVTELHWILFQLAVTLNCMTIHYYWYRYY